MATMVAFYQSNLHATQTHLIIYIFAMVFVAHKVAAIVDCVLLPFHCHAFVYRCLSSFSSLTLVAVALL